ncbi:MAG: quinone oxidoreductase [Pleurocapsa sp. SU_196_0]|nr:quinone oxidoreductase [Pleurocapsa sp. SU_196_0]
MNAIRVHQQGDASSLTLDDIAVPEPKSGEARVRVAYTGLNFIDIYQRNGTYKIALPTTLGMEGSGVVDAVGEGVTDLRVGARVAWAMQLGSYAEHAIVPAWKLAPLPDDISLETGAAVMLQGMTAHYLTQSTVALKPGDTVLVHAAAGGVGLLLVQIARRLGATVIATVGSEEKAGLARAAGAHRVINYNETDFEGAVKDFAPQGLEVVYDSVGRTTFLKGLNLLKPRGMMVLYGAASGPVEPLDLQVLNTRGSLFVTRPSLGHYTLSRDEILWRTGELFAWMKDGLEVRLDRTFRLQEAAEAHQYMESRQTKGKVVLRV